MNKTYYVYQLIDPRNGLPFYIGKGSGKRMHSHFRAVSNGHIPNGNPYLGNKIKKILSLNLKLECKVVAEALSEMEAFSIEIKEIKKFGKRGVGCLCNLTDGGEGPSGFKASREQIEANRQRAIERFKDPEYRKKYDAGRSRVDWEKVRSQQSKTLKKRFENQGFLKQHIRRMKRVHSEPAAIKRNSERMLDYYNLHPEQKERLSTIQKNLWKSGVYFSRLKEWSFISPLGNPKTFFNLSEFCRENSLTEANMRAVASGRRKVHKGWTVL